MKKLRNVLIASVMFFCLIVTPAMALADTPQVDYNVRVYDFADMLSGEEEQILSAMAAELSEQRQVEFAVVFTEDAMGNEPREYAEDFYLQNNFGYGETNDGILLYVNMAERDIFVLTCGLCTDIMDKSITDALYETVKLALTSGSSTPGYDAANAFLTDASEIFDELMMGAASDEPSADAPVKPPVEAPVVPDSSYNTSRPDSEEILQLIGIALGSGVVLAGIVVLIMRGVHNRKMLSPITATAYVKDGSKGISATHVIDRFVSTHTARTAIPQNDSSSGSSGGHSSGGSHSFGGSGGKF